MSSYTGKRIVPKHCGYWSSGNAYEVLSIVLYAATGDSYIAKKEVPSGTKITDTDYWAKSADFSAQLNTISNTVTDISSKVSALSSQVAENVSASTDADADYAAEVVDARIGTDGTVYASAGEAVREQFNTVNDALFEEGQNSYYNSGKSKTGTTIYYALAFTEKVYLYSLTPEFSGGNTFKWWVATCTKDIVGNTSSAITSIGDVNTASVGDTIIINQALNTNQAVVVAPDDNTNYPMMYCGTTGTAELPSAVICNASNGEVGNSVSQVKNCYFGGTFVLVEDNERFTTPEEVDDQIDAKLDNYVSQESLDSQFGDPSEYVKEDDIYDIAYNTYTNESDRSASGYSYALFATEEIGLYSYKPEFANSEGTFTWQLVECDADVCDATSSNRANITSYLTEAETVNVGEAFVVNQTMTTKMAIIITGNSTSGYQRFLTSEDSASCELSTVNIAQIASAGLYNISKSYRSSGTFVLVGKSPVYATMEEVEEKLEEYVSKEELDEFTPDGCVTDEELEEELYETSDTEFDVTISGSSGTSASLYYAIIFRKAMHLTSFTPVFRSGENTFTWCLFQTVDGSEFESSDTTATRRTLVALTEVTEQDMGTTIELDMDVDASMGLMIHGVYDADAGISDQIMYTSSSGMEEYFGLAQVNAASPTVISNPFYSTAPGYAYIGEYIFTVPVTESKYLPRSETDEKIAAVVEKLLASAVEEAKESANASNPLYGKKLVAIGDSMCRGQSLALANVWPALIAARNNMTYVNYGTNGDTMSQQFNTDDNHDICVRYALMDDDADYIIVYAGTNDASRSITPGDEDSTDTTEFYGALNVLMQGLISKYPKGKIGFITPTMSATASTTAKRKTYSDYIRTAAYNNGGIPVFDNITNAGVDYSNTEQYEALCMDSIHLNAEGQKHVSWKYEAFIRSL